MSLRHFFHKHTLFLLIIILHLGRHLGYIEMLNDARVASLGFIKYNVCTTRINKEKKFKIKFQVLLKFAQIPPDYYHLFKNCCRPVCIGLTFNNCWLLVYRWSAMEKQITSSNNWLPVFTLLTTYRLGTSN